MANRHKNGRFAKGGGVTPKRDDDKEEYTGKGSHVMEEAHEMKRGGKAHKHEHKAHGGPAKPRLDKKARGGSVKANKVHDGADMKSSPFSAAHTGNSGNPAENPTPHHLKHKGVR